jgi:hypothetical protein
MLAWYSTLHLIRPSQEKNTQKSLLKRKQRVKNKVLELIIVLLTIIKYLVGREVLSLFIQPNT